MKEVPASGTGTMRLSFEGAPEGEGRTTGDLCVTSSCKKKVLYFVGLQHMGQGGQVPHSHAAGSTSDSSSGECSPEGGKIDCEAVQPSVCYQCSIPATT